MITAERIDRWLHAPEDEHVEFKSARNDYSFDNLVKYCAALANEGGGALILGISDTMPREVVGSRAFGNLPDTLERLLQKIHLRITAEAFQHPKGRVVVFEVPGRPLGVPIEVGGTYWMRSGEQVIGMTPDRLRDIFDEATPDFSAVICPKATAADLDPRAIDAFRKAWAKKSGNSAIAAASDAQLLADSELVTDAGVTFAALALLGTHKALGRLLPQAEVVFEYRSSDATGPANQRIEFREGFFLFYERIWETVALRNDLQHYQEGMHIWDVPTFHETSVRELFYNAVAHRDYRDQGSVWVRQYPRRLEVVSPGGLPKDITVENILWRQKPRNRRISDTFLRAGIVERAGQGMNRVYETCIRFGNPLPDFTYTDPHEVFIRLSGVVEDPRLIEFLSKVDAEQATPLPGDHLLVVNAIHRGEKVPERLRPTLSDLVERGIVEHAGGGKHVLSRRFHAALGRKGTYTRKVGLDRETNKALLLKHIRDNAAEGARMEDLLQVLPSHSRGQVKGLLSDLAREGKARPVGRTKAARWFPEPESAE